jgi:hypothetical protein
MQGSPESSGAPLALPDRCAHAGVVYGAWIMYYV